VTDQKPLQAALDRTTAELTATKSLMAELLERDQARSTSLEPVL
jgi:hypothetical protein